MGGDPTGVLEPELSDGVVTLRTWDPSDAPALVQALNEPAIARFIEPIPQPYTLADAEEFIGRGPGHRFAVVDAVAGELLGGLGIQWNARGDVGEVGYWARSEARGRGVSTRALVLASRWALALPDVGRLQLNAEPENVASCRVAEKAGFRREGIRRAAYWSERHGRRLDFALYSLLPSDLEE